MIIVTSINLIFDDSNNINLLCCLNSPHINPDEKFNIFYQKLSACVNKSVPLHKVTKRRLKLKMKPWICDRILRLIKIRDRLFLNSIT